MIFSEGRTIILEGRTSFCNFFRRQKKLFSEARISLAQIYKNVKGRKSLKVKFSEGRISSCHYFGRQNIILQVFRKAEPYFWEVRITLAHRYKNCGRQKKERWDFCKSYPQKAFTLKSYPKVTKLTQVIPVI